MLARVARGGDERRLAHQMQRMAAEQRPVMIGAVGKHHVGKADFRGRLDAWRTPDGLNFRHEFANIRKQGRLKMAEKV